MMLCGGVVWWCCVANGRMKEWKDGRMKGCKDGRMEGWKDERM